MLTNRFSMSNGNKPDVLGLCFIDKAARKKGSTGGWLRVACADWKGGWSRGRTWTLEEETDDLGVQCTRLQAGFCEKSTIAAEGSHRTIEDFQGKCCCRYKAGDKRKFDVEKAKKAKAKKAISKPQKSPTLQSGSKGWKIMSPTGPISESDSDHDEDNQRIPMLRKKYRDRSNMHESARIKLIRIVSAHFLPGSRCIK